MSSLKRWRRVGQGQFHKWEQAGEEFEGTWRGAHDGRYGPLGTLETSGGVITFPLPAALVDRLPRMVEVLSKPGARDPEYVLPAVAEAVTGVKAADRAKQQAASIGTAMHAGIEWALRTQLGEDAGPEPRLPDAAAWAVESWKDWAKSVALEPLAIERTVYCEVCGYAGTLDLYARVNGVLTVLDWKSGKAIYPEAFLQNVAYRYAATRRGMPSTQGVIVRLPKYQDDPAWEAMPVPEALSVEDFRAALRPWRCQRRSP